MEISGVPPKKFRTISSSIDKLDKAEWAVVRAEMINEKGLDSAAADALEAFVAISGSPRAIYD
jgi:histidyl-tRNA synthetase